MFDLHNRRAYVIPLCPVRHKDVAARGMITAMVKLENTISNQRRDAALREAILCELKQRIKHARPYHESSALGPYS